MKNNIPIEEMNKKYQSSTIFIVHIINIILTILKKEIFFSFHSLKKIKKIKKLSFIDKFFRIDSLEFSQKKTNYYVNADRLTIGPNNKHRYEFHQKSVH